MIEVKNAQDFIMMNYPDVDLDTQVLLVGAFIDGCAYGIDVCTQELKGSRDDNGTDENN